MYAFAHPERLTPMKYNLITKTVPFSLKFVCKPVLLRIRGYYNTWPNVIRVLEFRALDCIFPFSLTLGVVSPCSIQDEVPCSNRWVLFQRPLDDGGSDWLVKESEEALASEVGNKINKGDYTRNTMPCFLALSETRISDTVE